MASGQLAWAEGPAHLVLRTNLIGPTDQLVRAYGPNCLAEGQTSWPEGPTCFASQSFVSFANFALRSKAKLRYAQLSFSEAKASLGEAKLTFSFAKESSAFFSEAKLRYALRSKAALTKGPYGPFFRAPALPSKASLYLAKQPL